MVFIPLTLLAIEQPKSCDTAAVEKILSEKHLIPIPKPEIGTDKIVVHAALTGRKLKFQRVPGIENPIHFSQEYFGGTSELLNVTAGTRWVIENTNRPSELIKIFQVEENQFAKIHPQNRLQNLIVNMFQHFAEKSQHKIEIEDERLTALINVEVELYMLAKKNGIQVAHLYSNLAELEMGIFRVEKIKGLTLSAIFASRPDLKQNFVEHKIKNLDSFFKQLIDLRNQANTILTSNGLEVYTQNPYTGQTEKNLGFDMALRNVMIEYAPNGVGEKITLADGQTFWIDINHAKPVFVDF